MDSSGLGARPATIAELLQRRAAIAPHALAYEIFDELGGPPRRITYGRLAHRAAAVAARLVAVGARPGDRAVLLFPPGEAALYGLFGGLWAGVWSAPAPVSRTPAGLERIGGILHDSDALFVLGAGPSLDRIRQVMPGAATAQWLTIDPDEDCDTTPSPYSSRADDVALIQYSSGSTGRPKGVLVRHRNILSNLGFLHDAFGADAGDSVVSWLPLHHDLGLVAGVLYPIYAGVPAMLMSPAAFLRRPADWLAAIAARRATLSGGPNFAYEHCLAHVTDEQLAGLDLSTWSVAITGAEPVRPETLERFAERFGACGFDRRAFYPTYGLAEATLMVSGGDRFQGVKLSRPVSADTRPQVGCGRPRTEVVIADPESLAPLRPGEIGEIFVRGAGVGGGYWAQPAASAEVFEVELAGRPGLTYLRTGDLGWIEGGELFVSGRHKDLIISRGRKLHPEDIETTARAIDPAFEGAAAAAFVWNADGAELLVVLQELAAHREPDAPLEVLARRVSDAVLARHGVRPDSCWVVRAGGLPRTSSGKIQRGRARDAYAGGSHLGLLATDRPASSGLRGMQRARPSRMEPGL